MATAPMEPRARPRNPTGVTPPQVAQVAQEVLVEPSPAMVVLEGQAVTAVTAAQVQRDPRERQAAPEATAAMAAPEATVAPVQQAVPVVWAAPLRPDRPAPMAQGVTAETAAQVQQAATAGQVATAPTP